MHITSWTKKKKGSSVAYWFKKNAPRTQIICKRKDNLLFKEFRDNARELCETIKESNTVFATAINFMSHALSQMTNWLRKSMAASNSQSFSTLSSSIVYLLDFKVMLCVKYKEIIIHLLSVWLLIGA